MFKGAGMVLKGHGQFRHRRMPGVTGLGGRTQVGERKLPDQRQKSAQTQPLVMPHIILGRSQGNGGQTK